MKYFHTALQPIIIGLACSSTDSSHDNNLSFGFQTEVLLGQNIGQFGQGSLWSHVTTNYQPCVDQHLEEKWEQV